MGLVRKFASFGRYCLSFACASALAAALTACSGGAGQPVASINVATYVSIPATNSIQTDLINTFPTGIFTAQNALGTMFSIPASPTTCGYTKTAACNFYDGFGFNGSGQSITMNVSMPGVGHVYSLMNAYAPSANQLATIEFIGSAGATVTFPLIGGEDIRDFLKGGFVNTLSNGVPNVMAVNAYTCVAPTACMGAGGTGNVTTGYDGTYVVDEQAYTLPAAFATQTLAQIVLTDTQNGSNPILLGISTGP